MSQNRLLSRLPMARKVLVLDENTTASVAARAMHERQVGSVLVCNHLGHLTGIVTDRDLSSQVLGFELHPDVPLSEVMTPDPLTLPENSSLQEVIQLMEEYGVRRIPIVEQQTSGKDRCVGIICLDDLIAAKALDAVTASRIVRSQIRKTRPVLFARGVENAEHTLHRFHRLIGKYTGLERENIEPFTRFVLSEVTQRLTATGAAHFLSQLPKLLQDEMLDLPAGPNRMISAQSLLEGLHTRFEASPEQSMTLLRSFWKAIREFTKNSGETDHVLNQLPETLRHLFQTDLDPKRQLGLYHTLKDVKDRDERVYAPSDPQPYKEPREKWENTYEYLL